MKLFLQILLILLVVSTVSICVSKPDMHKTLMVYDSAYTLVPEKQVEVEKEDIPIMEKPAEPVKEVKKVEQQTVSTTKNTSAVTKPVTTKKTQTAPQKVVKTETKPIVQTNTVKTEVKTVKQPETKKIVQETPKPVVVQTKTTTTAPKVLTEKEETIAWNIWRSNLQNKIMQDTRLPILPTGVVFKFSFSVDRYGKVSNVQTWSETPAYTPYAIQYIAPVIRSYQGRSILNFPEGTARITTEVKGGWRISNSEKYSTPQDYNDIEKVTR